MTGHELVHGRPPGPLILWRHIGRHRGRCPLWLLCAPGLLTEWSQLRLRQSLILRLRILVPAFFVPTAFSGAAVAFLDGMGPGFRFRCAGMLALIVWIAVRGIATVRINSATLMWDAEAPPKNWRALVDRAERFHILGVGVSVVAFVSFLMSAVLSLVPPPVHQISRLLP